MENEAAPIIAMLISECCQVGLIIISKQVMAAGMSTFIFVSYSNALAAFILLPFSFFLHRSQIPQLNLSLLGWFFLLALTGYLAQIFGYTGINYSSPTLASAMLNLVPGLTFLLAIILRMERLNLKTLTCLAKVVGTVVSIAGAFVLTLYEGPPLFNRPPRLHAQKLSLLGEQTKWILGGFLLGVDCIMTASCVIINAIILKKYPAELFVVFFYCFFVATQSIIVTFTVEKDLNAWSLKPTSRLLAILYSGFFGSAVQVGLSTWCLRRKGPVFVCMFKPLGVAIAAVAGVVFFGDTFYLGSLLGVIIIVLGFYSFMWGKAKEEKISRTSKFYDFPSRTQTVPLLGNDVEETVNSAA